MLESYRKLQQLPKTVIEFKNALHLIWSALPEQAIDNSVKDSHKRLLCQPMVDILNVVDIFY